MDKPTILVTAYAVNPYKGSEDGMGWNMILQIARFQKVIAITRENNQAAIERYIYENPTRETRNIQFEYFDTPYYMRFWKKGGRGALLYFYLWQYSVTNWIKNKDWKYDIVHNLNFHNDWTPSFLWKTKKPFVWGPIGHHPEIPKNFLKQYGMKSVMREGIRWVAKQTFWNFDPFLKKTKKEARHIFAMNSTVAKVLKLPEGKVSILPSVASEKVEYMQKYKTDVFNVLSIGRFVPLKGFDVTIRAFSRFYHELSREEKMKVKLTLVGKGPSEAFLKNLIEQHQLAGAVHIIPWIERDKLAMIYHAADAFLFPSHEGAGMVVSEALSYGLPVLCFDNCGPGEFVNNTCGLTIPYQDYDKVVKYFSEDLMRLFKNEDTLARLSAGARRQHRNRFTWDVKGEMFRTVYEDILSKQRKQINNETDKADYVYSSTK